MTPPHQASLSRISRRHRSETRPRRKQDTRAAPARAQAEAAAVAPAVLDDEGPGTRSNRRPLPLKTPALYTVALLWALSLAAAGAASGVSGEDMLETSTSPSSHHSTAAPTSAASSVVRSEQAVRAQEHHVAHDGLVRPTRVSSSQPSVGASATTPAGAPNTCPLPTLADGRHPSPAAPTSPSAAAVPATTTQQAASTSGTVFVSSTSAAAAVAAVEGKRSPNGDALPPAPAQSEDAVAASGVVERRRRRRGLWWAGIGEPRRRQQETTDPSRRDGRGAAAAAAAAAAARDHTTTADCGGGGGGRSVGDASSGSDEVGVTSAGLPPPVAPPAVAANAAAGIGGVSSTGSLSPSFPSCPLSPQQQSGESPGMATTPPPADRELTAPPAAALEGGAAAGAGADAEAATAAAANRLAERTWYTEGSPVTAVSGAGRAQRDAQVVGGGDGGATTAVMIPATMFTRLVAATVPDLLRAAKLLAAAAILRRAFRWVSTAAARAVRPRQEREEQRRRERKAAAAAGGRRGGEPDGDSLWRARESVLLQASGTRMPVDVVPTLDEAELEVAAHLVDCDMLDETFEDIAGMESLKRSLHEIISEPLEFPPDLFPTRLFKPCTGVLMYGPPGCGKTLLARAVAKQSGAAFISVKASTLMGRPGGGASGGSAGGDGSGNGIGGGSGGGAEHHPSVMVRAVFSLARKIQPCILFLDEADGLCFKREEGDTGAGRREVVTELMQLWDELSCAGQDRVVVLAATNRPWDLDPAIQRRFSRAFQVGLPDRKMRRAVLMKALEDVEVEEGFDWRELAVNTEGYSCGDVVELCREAVRGPLQEALDRQRRRTRRRQSQGLSQSRLHHPQERRSPQHERQEQRRRRGLRGQSDADSKATETAAAAAAAEAAAAAAAEAVASLPPLRLRPLRMSDVTAAQSRVVPAFWQAEAYRATYDGYMCSLMEHAKKNWSR